MQQTPWQRRQAKAGLDAMAVDTLVLQFVKPGDGVVRSDDGFVIPPEEASPSVFPLLKREHIRHSGTIDPVKHAEISEALVAYDQNLARKRLLASLEKQRLDEHDEIAQDIRWLFDGGNHYARMKQRRENIRLAREANARREITDSFDRPNLNFYNQRPTSIQTLFREMY